MFMVFNLTTTYWKLILEINHKMVTISRDYCIKVVWEINLTIIMRGCVEAHASKTYPYPTIE